MSRAEVEALLGPPGDHKTGPVTDPGALKQCFPGTTVDWESDSAWVTVAFDRGGGRRRDRETLRFSRATEAKPTRRPPLVGQAPVAEVVRGETVAPEAARD
jgi:hypothetical protein